MWSIFLLLVLVRISCHQNKEQGANCRLSQLEEEISRSKNTSPLHLRLRELKEIYPGDKFSRLQGSWCEDVSTLKRF